MSGSLSLSYISRALSINHPWRLLPIKYLSIQPHPVYIDSCAYSTTTAILWLSVKQNNINIIFPKYCQLIVVMHVFVYLTVLTIISKVIWQAYQTYYKENESYRHKQIIFFQSGLIWSILTHNEKTVQVQLNLLRLSNIIDNCFNLVQLNLTLKKEPMLFLTILIGDFAMKRLVDKIVQFLV